MRLPFQTRPEKRELRCPRPAVLPQMPSVHAAALYRGPRVGGDFFDFVTVGPRLLLLLLDIAGHREEALDIAASVQDTFRERSPGLFADASANETEAITALVLDLNRTILEAAGGVRCAPGFLACFNETYGTLTYVNAGSAALVREDHSVHTLPSNGLPLGLFSHATHEAQMFVVAAGAALLLATRGLLEVRSGSEQYGEQRLHDIVAATQVGVAEALCRQVLNDVVAFAEARPWYVLRRSRGDDALGENDITAVALVRAAAMAAKA